MKLSEFFFSNSLIPIEIKRIILNNLREPNIVHSKFENWHPSSYLLSDITYKSQIHYLPFWHLPLYETYTIFLLIKYAQRYLSLSSAWLRASNIRLPGPFHHSPWTRQTHSQTKKRKRQSKPGRRDGATQRVVDGREDDDEGTENDLLRR